MQMAGQDTSSLAIVSAPSKRRSPSASSKSSSSRSSSSSSSRSASPSKSLYGLVILLLLTFSLLVKSNVKATVSRTNATIEGTKVHRQKHNVVARAQRNVIEYPIDKLKGVEIGRRKGNVSQTVVVIRIARGNVKKRSQQLPSAVAEGNSTFHFHFIASSLFENLND